jgi:hypothetical protein
LTPTSAAADFGDQIDFAVGVERDEVGVLEDLTVDRHRHAFVDLAAETGKAAVERKLFASTSSSVTPPVNRRWLYCGQIFQITPVPGICTRAASAGFLNFVSGSD